MRTLIIESSMSLGRIWQKHLIRLGAETALVCDDESAIEAVRDGSFDVVVLDLDLGHGDAIALADYIAYRQPEAKLIFVTHRSFFSDGSILRHYANACGLVQTATPPEDLAAMVDHYGNTGKG